MTDQAIRVIRAAYTAENVTVYQAYVAQIADAAVRAGVPVSRIVEAVAVTPLRP